MHSTIEPHPTNGSWDNPDDAVTLYDDLQSLVDAATEENEEELAKVLIRLIECSQGLDRAEVPIADTDAAFLRQAHRLLHAARLNDLEAKTQLPTLIRGALDRCEQLNEAQDHLDNWEEEAFTTLLCKNEDNAVEIDVLVPSCDQLQGILSRLALDNPETSSVTQDASDGQLDRPAAPDLEGRDHSSLTGCSSRSIRPPEMGFVEVPELREAYLQDASRCVASMEQSILDYESNEESQEPLRQVCRELHTLKSASSIAGLADLGRYLHEVEDYLEVSHDHPSSCSDLADVMLLCVDSVRKQMESLFPNQMVDAPATTELQQATDRTIDTPPDEDSVYVKTSQLDRLMDMLAALVMLRNRRESCVDQLRVVNIELSRCASRLKEHQSGCVADAAPVVDEQLQKRRIDTLAEITNDVTEIGRTLRESYEPVAEENAAVSRFIRQFRQELLQLLRTPVSGLFRRLQRAAVHAARAEGKRVRFELVGAHAGLERSIQERLYDPLVHIVRNAVSHGIENADERATSGKAPTGTIRLEAESAPNLLVLTVRDDGKGLDYDALRRRGVELGLLRSDRPATQQELAQLIFHPGFSTRAEANEVSGRGVGMDVVAATLDRMHSWVEVASTPRQGTQIRLTVPLRSIIEHVMVFRSANQMFAVPMQFVRPAAHCDVESSPDAAPRSIDRTELVAARDLLSQVPKSNDGAPRFTIDAQPLGDTLARSACKVSRRQQLTILVDELLGPEEVVVRPLPPLLRHHTLLSGVTLSGNGKIVLVLEPRRLIEMGARHCDHHRKTKQDEPPKPKSLKPVLVVDDSLSARRSLSIQLRQRGYEAIEAADGSAATALLEKHTFAAVFTDLEMPMLDGLQLLAEIRSRTSSMPVVMLSSRHEQGIRDRAESLGVSRYLLKPVSEDILGQIIEELFH